MRGSPRPDGTVVSQRHIHWAQKMLTYDEEKSDYQLVINDASVANHEGNYRVVVKNELGETESTPCVVTVLEPVKLVKVTPDCR